MKVRPDARGKRADPLAGLIPEENDGQEPRRDKRRADRGRQPPIVTFYLVLLIVTCGVGLSYWLTRSGVLNEILPYLGRVEETKTKPERQPAPTAAQPEKVAAKA